MHSLLKRQLETFGLREESSHCDDPEVWRAFLAEVSRAYERADRGCPSSCGPLHKASGIASRVAGERDRLQAVVTALGAGLVVIDPAGRVVSANPECSRLIGYREEEMLGVFLPELLARTAGGALWERWRLADGAVYRDEDGSFVTKDGEVLWVSYAVSPIVEASGLRGAVVVFVDQGTLKRSEALMLVQQHELEKSREDAELASRAKSDFLATMSHEIRTPMNGILGLTGLLLELSPTPAQRSYLELVQSSGQVLLTLINDILDFSKIEAGRLDVERQPLLLRQAASEVLALLGARAREKGLQLIVEHLPGAPDKVLADPVRLRQVLMNLVGNAIKFSSRGQVVVRAEPVTDAGALVRVAVVDQGIGIRADRIGRLFQKFIQVDSSGARRSEGTGLGLAICRNLVEMMGGTMGVTSVEGVGSTFWFTLPTTELPVLAPEVGHDGVDAGSPGHDAGGARRVLLVDDNKVNRLVGQKMLERLGCHVDLASGGREAIAMADRCDYDLVFMDCQMPGIDGYAATRAIRAAEGSRRRVPIVAFTANALDGEQAHCLAAGMDDYLTKPIRPLELKSMLTRWSAPQSLPADPRARQDDGGGGRPRH